MNDRVDRVVGFVLINILDESSNDVACDSDSKLNGSGVVDDDVDGDDDDNGDDVGDIDDDDDGDDDDDDVDVDDVVEIISNVGDERTS